jgi:endonuclease/exonuclease/phosphatase family metal-dependent hydrolase
MTRTRSAAACALLTVLLAGLLQLGVSGHAGAEPLPVPTGPVDVRVASFNVRSVTKDGEGAGLPWRDRRAAVVRDILGEQAGVVGVQEASQSHSYSERLEDGESQMLDLVAGLKDAGGSYELTNTSATNCVRDWTISNCEYLYRGASRDARIIYNTSTLQLLTQGSFEYSEQSTGANDTRYLAYATFMVRSTGHVFLFANTHLSNASGALQKAQTRELIAKVDELRGLLPVVVVGDFQRSKFRKPIDFTLKAMKEAGYGDVLNQKFESAFVTRHRAQSRVNAWVNTMNGFKRDMRDYAYEDNRKKVGNNIDWIFASRELPVKEWKVVARFDKQRLRLTGVIPSDHFMVRATLTLP